MKITKWDEQAAEDIGHAFGYYDYGQETGMGAVSYTHLTLPTKRIV